MSETIALRRGDATDRAFVLDLGGRTAIASVSSLRPAPEPMVRASFARLIDYAFEGSYVLVIAEDTLIGPIGFGLFFDSLPDEVTGMPQGFVAYMAVDPDARRQGVGARLLAAMEAIARDRGFTHVALMVTEDNMPARELYAQAGYLTERRLLCKTL